MGEAPIPRLPANTTTTAMTARTNASGNQRSNHSERASPVPASQEAAEGERAGMGEIIAGVLSQPTRANVLWYAAAL